MPFLTLLWSNPWLRSLLLVLVVSLSTGLYGYRKGVNTERMEWEIKEKQVLESQLREVERLNQINAEVSAKLAKETARADANYRSYKDAISKVTDGRVCFTPDAWSLWLASLAGKDYVPPTTGTTPATSTGASDAQVLNSAVDNFRQFQACRTQLNNLILWVKKARGEVK